MKHATVFNEPIGLAKTATIIAYDLENNILKTRLNIATATGDIQKIDIPMPYSFISSNGMGIKSLPSIGTSIVISQGSGGQYYFVGFVPVKKTDELDENLITIYGNKKTEINVSKNDYIDLGNTNNFVKYNTGKKLITTTFDSISEFTQSHRKISGIVKRDLNYNKNFADSLKLSTDLYEDNLTVISLDPTATANTIATTSKKNPPFVEDREIVYELQYNSNISSDLNESSIYSSSPTEKKNYTFPNRRLSKSDTLSLSLVSPNYLMETVKGTVIDIFGNILDINRMPLPIGQGNATLRADKSTDKKQSFITIKELERKSLAYHFEINARKDLFDNGKFILPDINSNSDYARTRSRFFVDIDKEGQFKINVPASSEVGNVPLLTRYENYSTFGPEDDNNPNKLIYREDSLDIFVDSFAKSPIDFKGNGPNEDTTLKGSIQLQSDNAESGPKDRILNTHIRHGIAHHDILKTCYVHQNNTFLDYQASDDDKKTVNLSKITLLENVVSNIIKTSGPDANAGGRSGQINFDGSLELNVGANTVDRQSLWLDTAGGIVANIGRDKKNMSAAIAMNGDLFFQVGGIGVSGDSRFEQYNNGQIGAVVDLRVFTDGIFAHLIRLDNNGISIMSPGNIMIHSKKNLKITAGGDLAIEAETVTINERMVYKQGDGI